MTLAGEIGGKDLLYLDDLQVGQRFTSKTHRVDEAQIKAFASQFDPQPFHLDEGAAKDSLFSGLVASGWHTAAMTMRLLVERIAAGRRPHRRRRGTLLAAADQAWRHPARRERGSGDHPLAVAAGSRGRVARIVTRNQRDEEVQILVAKLSCRAVPSRIDRRHRRRRRYAMYSDGVSIYRLKACLA